MIESIFIILLLMAFIFFILAIEEWSLIYTLISWLLWITIFAATIYVQVPGDTSYNDATISALSLGFVFITTIFLFIIHFEIGFKEKPGQH